MCVGVFVSLVSKRLTIEKKSVKVGLWAFPEKVKIDFNETGIESEYIKMPMIKINFCFGYKEHIEENFTKISLRCRVLTSSAKIKIVFSEQR